MHFFYRNSGVILLGSGEIIENMKKFGCVLDAEFEKELKEVSYAKIWGEKSGFNAEMTINCDYLPTNTFAVQNADCYNKLYFSYAGGGVGHTVKIGEKWQIETKYEVYKQI